MNKASKAIILLSIILWLLLIVKVIILEDQGIKASWDWWAGMIVLTVVALYLRAKVDGKGGIIE